MELSSQVERCEERASGLCGEWGMREGKQKICPWLILTSRNPSNFREKNEILRVCMDSCGPISRSNYHGRTVMRQCHCPKFVSALVLKLLTSFLSPFWTVGNSMLPFSWKKNSLPAALMTCPPSQHLWLVQACTTYFQPSSKWKSLPLLPGFVTTATQFQSKDDKKWQQDKTRKRAWEKQLLKHIFLQLRIECLDRQRTWLPISLKDAECHASHLTNKPFVKSVVNSQVTTAMTLSAFETYIWLLNILPMAIRCAQ